MGSMNFWFTRSCPTFGAPPPTDHAYKVVTIPIELCAHSYYPLRSLHHRARPANGRKASWQAPPRLRSLDIDQQVSSWLEPPLLSLRILSSPAFKLRLHQA